MTSRAAIISILSVALFHCSDTSDPAVDGSTGGDASIDGAPDGDAAVDGSTGGDATSDAGDAGDADVSEPLGVVCEGKSADVSSGERTIESGGDDRSYRVFIPSSYDPAVGLPVVLNLHAYTQTAASQATLTAMNDKAEAESFIVVYPVGTGLDVAFNGGECCGWAALTNVDDVGYVADVLDAVEEELCVDTDRVFSTGFSNGGFMSHRLGCELSDRITGIAPVAGAMGIDDCNPDEPILVMGFHGTSDTLVSYTGSLLRGLPSFQDAMAGWAERNGCADETDTFLENGDSTCERFTGCPEGGAVAFCVVDDGGHAWPGGASGVMPELLLGKITNDVSATDEMWGFFAEHTGL